MSKSPEPQEVAPVEAVVAPPKKRMVKRKPARKQVEQGQIEKKQPEQTGQTYNHWYHKWVRTRYLLSSPSSFRFGTLTLFRFRFDRLEETSTILMVQRRNHKQESTSRLTQVTQEQTEETIITFVCSSREVVVLTGELFPSTFFL